MAEQQMQDERVQRAIAALAAGEYKVAALEPGVWSVVNGDNVPYRVTHQACECKDFENTGKLGIRCKHICAIHILFPQGAKHVVYWLGSKVRTAGLRECQVWQGGNVAIIANEYPLRFLPERNTDLLQRSFGVWLADGHHLPQSSKRRYYTQPG